MNDYLKKRQDFINAGRPTPPKKQYKGLNKVSPKTQAKKDKEKEERGDNDTELVAWYRQRMKYMGNTCNECGCKIENKIYQYAIMSICHLLPKRENMCPSVKTHPANWISLCVDHHHLYDNANWQERELMGCWETVRSRLIMLYEDLAPEERRHFPESVLKFMEKHSSF